MYNPGGALWRNQCMMTGSLVSFRTLGACGAEPNTLPYFFLARGSFCNFSVDLLPRQMVWGRCLGRTLVDASVDDMRCLGISLNALLFVGTLF